MTKNNLLKITRKHQTYVLLFLIVTLVLSGAYISKKNQKKPITDNTGSLNTQVILSDSTTTDTKSDGSTPVISMSNNNQPKPQSSSPKISTGLSNPSPSIDELTKNNQIIFYISDEKRQNTSLIHFNDVIELKSDIFSPEKYLSAIPVWSATSYFLDQNYSDTGEFFDQKIIGNQFYTKWKPKNVNEFKNYKIRLTLMQNEKKVGESGFYTANVFEIPYYFPNVKDIQVTTYLDENHDFCFKIFLLDSNGNKFNSLPKLSDISTLANITMTSNNRELFKKDVYPIDIINNGSQDNYYLLRITSSSFLASNPGFNGIISESLQLNMNNGAFMTYGSYVF